MGCDIHLHTEVKINGKWEHLGHPSITRNYALFEKMAGVRGDVKNAITPPRGLPEDATFLTKFHNDYMDSDGHSHSWLNSNELGELTKWFESKSNQLGRFEYLEKEFGYVFGNGWNVPKSPKDYPSGVEDTRAIFWFDN